MRSAERFGPLDEESDLAQRELDTLLLDIARRSIEHGLAHGVPLPVDPLAFEPSLRGPMACFVTLRRHGALRGCTGSLSATRPLVVDVAVNAFSAAFRDPRFTPLSGEEQSDLELHISILGPLEPLPVHSEAELVAALRPGVDGLVIAEGALRATFLPAVWVTLPHAVDFVVELKRKARIPDEHWSAELRCWRYGVREIGEAHGAEGGSAPRTERRGN